MGRQKHILVVDDNSELRDVIAIMLEDCGYQVSAANGATTRDFLKTDQSVDAVVLRGLMPGEPDVTLIDHLKELGLPVVLISGWPKAMEYAEKHGLQLLLKPFRTEELCDLVEKALSSGAFG